MLQLFEAGNRQQQGFAGIARRVQVETPAVDQLGHRQQFTGLIALQAGIAPPLRQERWQGFGFDPEEFHVDLVDIQRDHRQALGQARRQQSATAGEADGGLQVAGFQAGAVFGGEGVAVDCLHPGVHGQHQLALRLKVTQAQLHKVIGQFPGAIDLAGRAVYQVQLVGEFLIGVQGDGKTHRQGAGPVQLHLGHVHHAQLAPGIALLQRCHVHRRFGRFGRHAWRCRGRGCSRFIGRITGAQQGQRASEEQSFVKHGGTRRQREPGGELYISVGLAAAAPVTLTDADSVCSGGGRKPSQIPQPLTMIVPTLCVGMPPQTLCVAPRAR